MKIIPIKHADANEFVRKFHRHNKPTIGAIFCVAVAECNEICGVAICGRPIARYFDDGFSIEILRVATDGSRNACSMLYGACRKAAKALGYCRILTYTLPEEGGSSLKAAGFHFDGEAGGSHTSWHSRPNRKVQPVGDDLIGGKWRWLA